MTDTSATLLPRHPRTPRSRATELIAVDETSSDGAEIGRVAGRLVVDFVRREPYGVLGVATGSSPEPVYAALARARAQGLKTEGLHLVALDEYVGLREDDARGYRAYVRERIARPLGIGDHRVVVPEPARLGAEAAAEAHEARILALGGVGLQIVGIGSNGHLGFNEPGSPLGGRTRVVELAATTRHDNARYFGGDPAAVPARAVTQGIGTVLDSGHVVLVARGEGKAEALALALLGPIDALVPASALQRHPRVTVVADRPALARMTES